MGAKEIISLNKTELAKISIEELEKRLKHEENNIQCWTCGCDCQNVKCSCYGYIPYSDYYEYWDVYWEDYW